MRSSNRIRDAFDSVRAEEELKSRTKEYLQEARQQAEKRERHPRAGKASFRLAFGSLCVMLLLFLGIGGYTFLRIPVSYVSIDVNPSIEFVLNRLDRVISAEAYNEDGKMILDNVAVEGLYYTDAVERMMESEAMKPYLSENAGLTFTVAADSGERENALLSGIENTSGCREHGGVGYGADISAVQEAHETGLSLGKYAAYQILSHYDSSVTTEDCHNMTMSEIHGLIEAHEHGHNGHGEEGRRHGGGSAGGEDGGSSESSVELEDSGYDEESVSREDTGYSEESASGGNASCSEEPVRDSGHGHGHR